MVFGPTRFHVAGSGTSHFTCVKGLFPKAGTVPPICSLCVAKPQGPGVNAQLVGYLSPAHAIITHSRNIAC